MRMFLLLATCILASGGAYAATAGLASMRVVSFGAILVSFAAAWTAVTLALRRRAEEKSIRGTVRAKAGPDLVTQAELELAARRAAARAPAPELEDLAWDFETVVPVPEAPPVALAPAQAPDFGPEDPLRRKILDRYISARFSGVATGAGELADATRVVKAARLLFEDGQPERGLELLQVASDLYPQEPSLQLARLELLFLERDAAGYDRAARRFEEDFALAPEWPEIRELGRKLGLGGERYRDCGVRAPEFPQYGPWPGLPNWIQAPWDLSGEVAMAELHARMVAMTQREAVAAEATAAARRAA